MNTMDLKWVTPELVVLVKDGPEKEVLGMSRIDQWLGMDICRCDE